MTGTGLEKERIKNKTKEKKKGTEQTVIIMHGHPIFFCQPDNKLAVVRSFSLLQIVFASKTWETVPAHVKSFKGQYLSVFLKSRADSTAKRYVGNIRAFLKWCRLNNIEVAIPVSAATVAIYMFQLVQKQTSAVTLVRH